MAAQDDNLPMVKMLVVGASSLLGTVAIVLALVGLTRRAEQEEFDRKVLQVPYAGVAEGKAAQRERLEGYGWVDREAGKVHIPIERAMGLLSKELRGGQGAEPRSGQ
jgi:hypothetical protein